MGAKTSFPVERDENVGKLDKTDLISRKTFCPTEDVNDSSKVIYKREKTSHLVWASFLLSKLPP